MSLKAYLSNLTDPVTAARIAGELLWAVWKPIEGPEKVRAWTTNVLGWAFIACDFDISNQPGRSPGDRGQNLSVTSPMGQFLLSDHPIAHAAGAEVVRGILAQEGTGKTSSRTVHFQQKEHYEVRNKQDFDKACAWTRGMIEAIGSAIWKFERSPQAFRFNQARKIAYRLNPEIEHLTSATVEALGYTIKPWSEQASDPDLA